MSNMILTSECEKCAYGSVDDSNKARVKVKCSIKGKEYHWGQCIPCDTFKKEENNDMEKYSDCNSRSI